jgi:hypothetical protein
MIYNATVRDLFARAGVDMRGPDTIQFVHQITAYVAYGRLRLTGVLNGRGPRRAIDRSVTLKFTFHIVGGKWILMRNKALEEEGPQLSLEAGAIAADGDLSQQPTIQIHDLLFCDEDVDELFGLPGSRPLPDERITEPKHDPVPPFLSDADTNRMLGEMFEEGLGRDDAIQKLKGLASVMNRRVFGREKLREIWTGLTGRRRGRPSKN